MTTAVAEPLVLGTGGRAVLQTCSVSYDEVVYCLDDGSGTVTSELERFADGMNGAVSAQLTHATFSGGSVLPDSGIGLPAIEANVPTTAPDQLVLSEFFGLRNYRYVGEAPTTRTVRWQVEHDQTGGHYFIDGIAGFSRAAVGVFEGPLNTDRLDELDVDWAFLGDRVGRFDIRLDCGTGEPTWNLGAICLDGEYLEAVEAGSAVITLAAAVELQPGQIFAVFAYLTARASGGGYSAVTGSTFEFLDESGSPDDSGIEPLGPVSDSLDALPVLLDLLFDDDMPTPEVRP